MFGPRASIVLATIAITVLISCSDAVHSPVGLDPAFSFTGDTVPCPSNEYGLVKCKLASGPELTIMRTQATRIVNSASGECFDAGQNILGGLNSGPVYIHYHGDAPGALISRDLAVGPPHPFVSLQVAWYLLEPAHVRQGNLLNALYHEGAHLLDYTDVNDAAANFAADCIDRFHIEEEDVEEPIGGGGGGDDNCECDWLPTECLVRFWYWKDTGEIVHFQILYCY